MADAKEMPVLLDRAGLIEIAGADAVAFAHAQFASDVASLSVNAVQWSAWLSAQGRTRAVFALLRVASDRLLVWMPLGSAPRIREALVRFVLRSKVTLAVHSEWMLGAFPDGSLESAGSIETRFGGFAFALPGPKPRVAWLGPAAGEVDSDALDMWRRADIAAGLPWIDEATEDQFVPQALDLQRLDAVRFDKGCYPGQEIAARLHFRGGNKQKLHRVTLHGDADAPPGLRIEGASGPAGMLLYSAPRSTSKREGLAVLSDAAISADQLVSVSGHSVELPQPSAR